MHWENVSCFQTESKNNWLHQLTHLSVLQRAAVWGIPAHSSSPLGWPHRWYHLIDAFFGCRWRRSNSIMPWSKPPLSALQFACTLQSHCAARTTARWLQQPLTPVKSHWDAASSPTQKQKRSDKCLIKKKKLHNQKHHVRDTRIG